MGMMSEFKEFAMRGNVIDLAVGVVIGAAFGKIVTALVEKIIMPPLGMLIGKVDFMEIISPAMILILLGYIPVVFLTTFWPDIALWLPRIMGYV